jgi:hypothetical protein
LLREHKDWTGDFSSDAQVYPDYRWSLVVHFSNEDSKPE